MFQYFSNSNPNKDEVLADHPESACLNDRRSLLCTVKEIFTKWSGNMNYFAEKEAEKISLLDHVKRLILKRMLSLDNYLAENEKEERKKTQSIICSSESETDSRGNRQNAEKLAVFQSVIDDYVGENGKSGGFHKSMIRATENIDASSRKDINIKQFFQHLF